MKKLFLILISTFLFFGCASKGTEAESLIEKPEVSPIVQEDFDETVIDENDKLEVIEENESIETDSLLQNENLPMDEIENIDTSSPNSEVIENVESQEFLEEPEKLSLLITPEDYESPDYVEFLPISNIEEETLDVNFDSETQEENIAELLDNNVISSDENDTLPSIEDTQNNTTDLGLNNTGDTEIFSENQQIGETEILKPEIENSPFEDETLNNTELKNLDENFSTDFSDDLQESLIDEILPEIGETLTEDIPLEDIFTPDENFIPLEPEESIEIVPTRSMVINNNQILKVSYPGTGWIFLGDEYDSETLIFNKRDIYDDSTEFFFKTMESGTALLNFYKQDLLTNEQINDYLLVEINPKNGKLETIEAPKYSFVNDYEEYESLEEYFEDEYYDFGFIEDEPEVMFFSDEGFYFEDDDVNPKEIIDSAESFFNDELYIEALDQLNYYFDLNNDIYTDYALFLKGQILEKNTIMKNIKESLACYKEIINNYPDSIYWDEAMKKAKYLERFYFSVR